MNNQKTISYCLCRYLMVCQSPAESCIIDPPTASQWRKLQFANCKLATPFYLRLFSFFSYFARQKCIKKTPHYAFIAPTLIRLGLEKLNLLMKLLIQCTTRNILWGQHCVKLRESCIIKLQFVRILKISNNVLLV